jgi:hypothetical protein
MGKPLGMGSIEITPELFLSNRKKRYEDLFFEWNEKEIPNKSKEIFCLIEGFSEYVLRKLDENKSNFWDLDRMQELKIMLGFNSVSDSHKVEYMEMEEFKKKEILPKPSEIKD